MVALLLLALVHQARGDLRSAVTTLDEALCEAAPSGLDPMRKTALAAGLLYIATFVTSIPPLPLYHDLLEKPGYLLSGASDTGVLWGAFLEIFCGLTGIGTAVVLHRVLKRESDTAALGFVASCPSPPGSSRSVCT